MNEFLKPKNEQKDIQSEQMKNVQEVFKLCPELSHIGTPEQYEKYLETIFPESKVKEVVYHNSDNEIKNFDRNHEFYQIEQNKNRAFYFSINRDFWKRKNTYPALLSIERLATPDLQEDKDFVEVINQLHDEGYEIGYQNPITIENVISEIQRGSPYVLEIPEISKFLKDHKICYKTPEGGCTYAVFEPEQIHILGSKADVEEFGKFVANEK
jgi:hypothetical protein